MVMKIFLKKKRNLTILWWWGLRERERRYREWRVYGRESKTFCLRIKWILWWWRFFWKRRGILTIITIKIKRKKNKVKKESAKLWLNCCKIGLCLFNKIINLFFIKVYQLILLLLLILLHRLQDKSLFSLTPLYCTL